MAGITSYGAYIPMYRLSLDVLSQVWGGPRGRGEKAIANWDEDSITMAVEAGVDCLADMERQVDELYFATTTSPYKEKQCATIIADAFDLPDEVFTMDITNSLRGGTIAIKTALDAIKGGSAKKVLIVVSDNRVPAPDSEFEPTFGDGAAAFVLGDSDVAVEIEDSYTISSSFMDTWRREADRYLMTWEDRFIFEEGYQKILPAAVFSLMKRKELTPKDFTKVVLSAPDARRHTAMVRTLGFDAKTQVQDHMFDKTGHTGCASLPMMLVAALEEAKPGDRILLANYSDGADVLILRVTDQIEKVRDRRGIKRHLESKMMLSNYGRYLHFRNLAEWEPERRPPMVSPATVLWRDRNQIVRFHGGKCRQCGTIQYPIQRVCAVCQAKDDYEEVRLSDKKGKLATFAMDERAMVPDLPCVTGIVDFEGGGRYFCTLTDRDPGNIKVGMPVELAFRKVHQGSRTHTYTWMARPIRC
jgi:3-hydroxy-3-methylglutaryl CoA synthase